MRLKYFYLSILILTGVVMLTSCQQSSHIDTKKKFTPSQLQMDLNYLIATLEERHVDFYERANPDSIRIKREIVNARLNREMNRFEFFQEVGQLNPYFHDAHCLVFPLIEEADARKAEGCKPFPFHVILDESGALKPERSYIREADGIIVDKSWNIESINGIEVAALLDHIVRYSHGETALLRRNMTTLLFADWLFTLYGWCGTFDIAFKNDQRLHVQSADQWKSLERNVVQYNRLEILEDNIGYLRLGSFDVDEVKNEYEKFIHQSFDSLARLRIQKLIIDVRGNTGGQSDAGACVLQFLTDKELSQVSKAYDRIHKGNSGWFNFRGQPGELKEIDLSSDDMIKPVVPEKRFKGEVLVLFDEMTYSAGIIFITIVQDHKLAKTVGRPTGGFANQTGNMETFLLPNSKLTVYMPSRKFIRVNRNASVHRVTPDVLIETSDQFTGINDLVLKRSIQMLTNK